MLERAETLSVKYEGNEDGHVMMMFADISRCKRQAVYGLTTASVWMWKVIFAVRTALLLTASQHPDTSSTATLNE